MTDLLGRLQLDRSAVSHRVKAAIARGFLRNLEDKKGKIAKLVLGDAMPQNEEILP